MSILENPVFKHRKILEECEIDYKLADLQMKKSILNCFNYESSTIIKPKIELNKNYDMPEWIKCKHRMRRYEEGLGVQSYCLHPLNPLSTNIGLYLVSCDKKECKLEKYYDIF